MPEPSQTPNAIRQRRNRANKAAQKGRAPAASSPLYDPDAAAPDAAPPDRRAPGRPEGPRSLTRSQSIAALLGIANLPLRTLFPQDALTAPEVRALADGLVKDPWTGPYVEHLVGVGKHTDLVEAIGMIVMGRLVVHGILPVDALLSMMPGGGQPPRSDNSGSTTAEPPAWDAPGPTVPTVDATPAGVGEPEFLRA